MKFRITENLQASFVLSHRISKSNMIVGALNINRVAIQPSTLHKANKRLHAALVTKATGRYTHRNHAIVIQARFLIWKFLT